MGPIHGLQVVSDIHLEFRGKWIKYDTLLPQTAVDLALCGDIGRPFLETSGAIRHYKEFLRYTCNYWRHVFIITGNHSYYGRTKKEVDACITNYCAEINENSNGGKLHFLNDLPYYFTEKDDVVNFVGIYGSTLWTNVSDMAFGQMNDCRIKPDLTFETNFHRHCNRSSADLIRMWHQTHKDNLRRHLQEHQVMNKKRWVVMTHHAPKSELDQEHSHADAFTKSAYVNDLDSELFDKEKVAVWLSGHLHVSVDKMVDGIRCVSNCMGYPNERHTGYKHNVIIQYRGSADTL